MSRIVPAPIIGQSAASGAQVIDGSLKFNHSNETHLVRTPSSAGNRRTFTVSAWIKVGGEDRNQVVFFAGPDGDDTYPIIWHNSSDGFQVSHYQGGFTYRLVPNAVHRDTGWYHVVSAHDTTQSTASNRIKLYINGEQVTSFSTETYPSLNYENSINESGQIHKIGFQHTSNAFELNGSLSQFYFIDGQQLGPENFGFTDPLTGTWRPKKYSGNYTLSTINDGTVWSGGTYTGTTSNSGYGVAEAFNGLGYPGLGFGSGVQWGFYPGTATLTLPKAITFTSDSDTFEIYSYHTSGSTGSITFTCSNGSVAPTLSTNATNIIGSTTVSNPYSTFGSEITAITLVSSGSDWTAIAGIVVNGVVMVDGKNGEGINSFYLPMDGNSPIGQDKSGNGNDWTPVNFGGSVSLDNPLVSGARPILNTTQGGTTAGVGVFGSKENKFYTVTTANGGVYQFDITSGNNPSLEFIRGATYKFDYSSHTGHPVLFSSTNPDSSTTAYTTGTNIASNVISFTVPHDAPDTLYYYCQNHATAMNGAISVTTDNTKADQYAANCVLAVPFVFRDMGDVSASIACTSSTETISNQGNAADKGEQSNFYNRSFYFDGTGDYVITSANTNDLVINTGDFTLEAWIWNDITGRFQGILSDRPNAGGGVSINITNGNKIEYYAGGTIYNTTFNVPQQSWHHVAFTRKNGTMYSFFDGVLLDSRSATNDNGDNAGIWNIGRYYYNRDEYYYKGYVQDARIYQGVAKYTSDFVVPSTSPDILPDTPSGVSGGSKLAKITDGSHGNPALSGIRQFGNISVADSTDLEFGSGDFTLEAFIYYTGNPGTSNSTYAIFSKWNNQSAPSDKGFILRISDDGSGDNLQWFYTTDGSTNLTTTGSTLLNPNTWYHIAFVRNGSTGTFYVDGVADSTTVSFGSNSIRDTGNAFRIGANLDSGKIDQEFSGFISNVRVVKGDAVYTGNFTPPAAPLTSITNTKILACQDNDYNVVGITTTAATGASPIFTTTGDYGETYGDGNLNADSNASNLVLCLDFYANATDRMPSGRPSNQKSLSAGGDPDPGNTTTSHLYGKSAYFDGNDSYSISSSADFSFDGEFCVELWANASSWGPFFVSGGTNGIWLGSTSNGLVLRRYGVANDLLVQIPPYDEWVHLAFTRDGSDVIRLFINGEEQASSVVTNTYTQNTLYIGTDGAGAYYTGYIQDLRVYKGTAKYTSDFNPPFRSLNRVKAAVSPSQLRHTWYAGGPVSFSPFNTDINTVRGQESGYATLNPLKQGSNSSLSDGNLKYLRTSNGYSQTLATISVSSGKWYYEHHFTGSQNNAIAAGIVPENDTSTYPGQNSNSVGYNFNGTKVIGTTQTSYGATYDDGDVIGVAFDADNGTVEFYKNGVSQGTATSALTSGPYTAGVSGWGNGTGSLMNFGQKPFKFPPPDGFQPLNAANVRPETVIARPDQYFGVKKYTGNGSAQKISFEFGPDLVWTKMLDVVSNNILLDTLRGQRYWLNSDNSNAEGDPGENVITYNSDGFTVGNQYNMNANNEEIVAWCWRAGGSKNTFNVDDVGYASASDVNMSVGALNNASYNQTQNWSAGGGSGLYGSSTWAPTFDGTPAPDGHNITHSAYVTNNGSSTLTFSTAISGVLTVKTCQGSDSTSSGTSRPYVELSNGQTIRVDGGTSNPSTHSFGEVSNITSLTIRGTSAQGMNLIFVKLDGKLLVDSGVTVNAPSIAPSGCSVGTKQGFSIIKYDGNGTAGSSIPHGLLQTPEFVVVKDTEDSDNWQIYHAGAQTSGAKLLKFTDTGSTSNNGPWNNTAPTSTLITLGGGGTNDSGNTHICYAWHSVPGLQKFGSWTGINSADGNFVELGFRPALVIAKESSATGAGAQWFMLDSSRNTYNPLNNIIDANRNIAERQAVIYDFLSNGFKVRTSFNSGATFIYMAWAEAPSFNLFGAQSNAR